ncbi:MAG: enoyl-CoA hydratase [Alphaproteobacteria bacterium]|nr:enoyl-CoA hydratase [Alphaproteobacteria bacterium]
MAEPLIHTKIIGRVMVITLSRSPAMNALSQELISQLNHSLRQAEADSEIGAMVITGDEKAFAAGADIKEMKDLTFQKVFAEDFIETWEYLSKCRKPTIAAVSGYALGGGCELAMMCDIILAADTAQFGQPEITLGTIPGAGGTQRLTHLLGKVKAMELCLTGRLMDAQEAERCGLVARVVPEKKLMDEALSMAKKIADFSLPAVQMIKEAICAAENMPLTQGIRFERHLFQASFALEDRKEGMNAFLEKRKPSFKNK